jgi:hypothetical protein
MKLRVGIGQGLFCLLSLVILSCMPISLAQLSQPDAINGKLLYDDNFSTSKNSIFSSYSDANSNILFENGKVRFTVRKPSYWIKCSGGNVSDNIILETEATQVSGPNDNAYGVIFRNKELRNYYIFMISGDGYYYINKVMNKTYGPIKYYHNWSPILWKKSNAIQTGNATNLIRVSCNGDKFSFYVNNVKVDEFIDDSLPTGNIGLIAGTNEALGTVIIDFDNLKVWTIAN